MSGQTPEPWSIGCVGLLGIGGNLTTTIIKLTPGGTIYPAICQAPVSEESEANARHIVACVNNCEGINPKAVPDLWKAVAVLPICYVLRYVAIQLLPPDQPPVHQLLTMIAEGTRAQQIAVILAAVVLAPLAEEMFFRGLLQTMLRKYLHSPWLAIALGSAACAAVHLPVQDIPAIFALSVVLGYNYERCGRLYASILMHALFNAANIWMFLSTHSG